MAFIQKIRDKGSIILIIMIGLGLGGFILMDMMSGQQSLFGGPQTTLGSVEGMDIGIQDYQRRLNEIYGSAEPAQQEQLWNFYVEESLLQQEAAKMGMGISKQELKDFQFVTPDPVITRFLPDPANPARPNMEQLNQVKQAIETGNLTDPNLRYIWAHVEREVIKNRLQNKMGHLVSKGMYTPAWMAQMVGQRNSQQIDFLFARVPYAEIDNAEVSVDDGELKSYLKDNREQYERDEEERVVSFVTFNVVPTAQDTQQVREQVVEARQSLLDTAQSDTLIFERYDGTISPLFATPDKLPANIGDTLAKMPVGTVYGPYLEGGLFKVTKVMGRRMIADSVQSRHILRQVDQNQEPQQVQAQLEQARLLIDSLKNVIESGQNTFENLASVYGMDATKDKGGDLGFVTQGRMVKPFNDYIFLKGEVGELGVVETQFGVHLVEVMERRSLQEGTRIGTISVPMIPSDETQNSVRTKALAFAADNRTLEELQSAASEMGMQIVKANPVNVNGYVLTGLGSGAEAREIVKWAFSPGVQVGDVSSDPYAFTNQQFIYDEKYVVVGLDKILEPGLPELEDVRDEVMIAVTNKKKAALIQSRITNADPVAVAAQFNVAVDTARNVGFQSSFVPNLGREPKVLATAFELEAGQTAATPIPGEGGVYAIKVTNKPLPAPVNIQQARRQAMASTKAQVYSRLLQGMKSSADIEDNRFDFNY